MRVTVIINPASGRRGPRDRARRRAALAEARLSAAGVSVQTAVTEGPGHAHTLARDAVAAGADVVAAWGGDGTMNEVASALVGGHAELALIPGGSGNGLARDLGIPLAAERAIDVVWRGRARHIDGGQLDGRWFFNVAGLGLDARVAVDFQERGGRGLLAYLAKTTREVLRNAPTRCTIEASGRSLTVDALLVAVANSRQYGNGLVIAPGARLDDGQLDLVVVPGRSRSWLLARVPWLLAGALDRVPGVQTVAAASAVISSPSPITYHVDGEPHTGGTALAVTVHPRVLPVRVAAGRVAG